MRILLAEDEPAAAQMLAKGLREQTYAVDVAADGEAALEHTAFTNYDLLILDVMLPRLDGFTVCRQVRAVSSGVPILILTARDGVEDRITGLDAGADDYLSKPFDFHELLARVRALLRRRPVLRFAPLVVGDLVVDTRTRRVRRAGQPLTLTAKEYALLEYLASRAEEVVGRADIAEHVWDATFDPFSNLIEVYVQRLRRKLDHNFPHKLLRTRRGAGYVLTASSAESDA